MIDRQLSTVLLRNPDVNVTSFDGSDVTALARQTEGTATNPLEPLGCPVEETKLRIGCDEIYMIVGILQSDES